MTAYLVFPDDIFGSKGEVTCRLFEQLQELVWWSELSMVIVSKSNYLGKCELISLDLTIWEQEWKGLLNYILTETISMSKFLCIFFYNWVYTVAPFSHFPQRGDNTEHTHSIIHHQFLSLSSIISYSFKTDFIWINVFKMFRVQWSK